MTHAPSGQPPSRPTGFDALVDAVGLIAGIASMVLLPLWLGLLSAALISAVLWWRLRRSFLLPLWIVLLLLALAAGARELTSTPADRSSDNHRGPALKVSTMRVESPVPAKGVVYTPPSPEEGIAGGSQAVSASASKIVITLNNPRDRAIAVTGAALRVLRADKLQPCWAEGDNVETTGWYDLAVPNPPPPRPFSISKGFSFRVRPRQVDQLELKVGLSRYNSSTTPWLLHGRVSLRDDEDRGRIPVGRVGLILPGGGLQRVYRREYPGTESQQRYDECAKANSALVGQYVELGGYRSAEFNQLAEKARTVRERGRALPAPKWPMLPGKS